jgi:hypothetical protein
VNYFCFDSHVVILLLDLNYATNPHLCSRKYNWVTDVKKERNEALSRMLQTYQGPGVVDLDVWLYY